MLLSETENNNGADANRRACNIPCAVGDPMHVEKSTVRNLGGLSGAQRNKGPVHEGKCRTMNIHTTEKSDRVIVPKKGQNKGKANNLPADVPEGRTRPKGNCLQEAAARTQCRGIASFGLQAVRRAAQRHRFNARTQGRSPVR
jgi:hypothetical protein